MEHRNHRTASRFRALGLLTCLTVAALIMVAPAAAGKQPTVNDRPAVAADAPPPETAAVTTEAAAVATSPAPAAAAALVGPQLSIGIDNGKTSTTVDDKMDYVITVQNLGSTDVDDLQINQTVPAGLSFGTADADGTASPSGVSWKLDLKATTTATFHTSMTVAATPPELLRLATVACASVSSDAAPIVCASHSDQLPAGAAAQASQAAMQAGPIAESQPWWWVLLGVAVVIVLGGLVLWWVLSRRRRPPVTAV